MINVVIGLKKSAASSPYPLHFSSLLSFLSDLIANLIGFLSRLPRQSDSNYYPIVTSSCLLLLSDMIWKPIIFINYLFFQSDFFSKPIIFSIRFFHLPDLFFKRIKKFIGLFFLASILLFTLNTANAVDITVPHGEAVTVEINSRLGTLVEFPRPLLVVSAAAHFKIQRITTQVNKRGKAVDVRIVKITAKPQARTEEVAFILNGHRSLTLQLKAQHGAAKHQRLVFTTPSFSRGGAFMSREIALMQQLLKDKGNASFGRTVTRQKFALQERRLTATLIRKFSGQHLQGKVFSLHNRSKQAVAINPQLFNLPRAALFHSDHDALAPCKTGNCITSVRLVLRDVNFVAASIPTGLPFSSGGGR